MRENRPYGSEGGGIEINRSSLPLSLCEHGYAVRTWLRCANMATKWASKTSF